jgi:hypothetical protein
MLNKLTLFSDFDTGYVFQQNSFTRKVVRKNVGHALKNAKGILKSCENNFDQFLKHL